MRIAAFRNALSVSSDEDCGRQIIIVSIAVGIDVVAIEVESARNKERDTFILCDSAVDIRLFWAITDFAQINRTIGVARILICLL